MDYYRNHLETLHKMTMILCPNHGTVGVEMLCEHAYAAYAQNEGFDHLYQVLGSITPPEWFSLCWVCAECKRQIPESDTSNAYYYHDLPAAIANGLKPACHRCFDSYFAQHVNTVHRHESRRPGQL